MSDVCSKKLHFSLFLLGVGNFKHYLCSAIKLICKIPSKISEAGSGGSWNRMGTETGRTGTEPGHGL